MIDQLKVHFGKAFIQSYPINKDYEWFQTKYGETFGILHEALTDKEKALLSSLFTPLTYPVSTLNTEESAWVDLLYKDDMKNGEFTFPDRMRFIHFFIKSPLNDEKETFAETVKSLFPYPIINGKNEFI